MGKLITTRHPLNANLRIINEKKYKGVKLGKSRGMVLEYLDALIDLTEAQVSETPETVMVGVHLHYPKEWSNAKRLDRDAYHQFMHSLNSKIRSISNKRGVEYKRVRFCRVIEDSKEEGLHIHAVLYFNRNVVLDRLKGKWYDELYNHITEAWLKALSTPTEIIHTSTLVRFHDYGHMLLDGDAKSVLKALGYYAHICKVEDKRYDIPVKTFSRSIS